MKEIAMYQRILTLLLVCACTGTVSAQDLSNIQIHGFATQGFLYSSTNNFLGANTSAGTLQWTDGAVSVSDAISDKLRVGIQLHMSQLGEFGGPEVQVDWASGDYKVNDYAGFRAGKIKTPLGLFNDSQDVDAVHLWALLPQGMYPLANRSFYLSILGGEFYGAAKLGPKAGTLIYRGYVGYRSLDINGGYQNQINSGVAELDTDLGQAYTPPTTPAGGNVYGGDIRWKTPLKGLLIGTSTMIADLHGSQGAVTFGQPMNGIEQHYAQFERGKFFADGEYRRQPVAFYEAAGPIYVPIPLDWRSWYVMGGYHVSEKLQVGSYYSHFVDAGGGENTSLPANYSKDWTISGRYDFNPYFYAKLEEHFVHGTDMGYYSDDNPNGEQSRSNILAAKIGFSF
jgi:hypothetical protein